MAKELDRLVEELRHLPGIGAKSARRIAYHIVEMDEVDMHRFIQVLEAAKASIHRCSICFSLGSSDPCEFCMDEERDHSMILVVENARDVVAIEKSGGYKGLYHVLEGALSPIDGIGVEDIRVKELLERLRDERVNEVILATDPDVEGEATALYLSKLLQPTGVRVTRIARGIPMGGDIEYVDEMTLGGAVINRQDM